MNNSFQIDPKAITRIKSIGGEALLKRLLDIFSENALPYVESAISNKNSGNLTAVEHSVHSLKSSAANIGALSIQELSEQIEIIAGSGRHGDIDILLEHLFEVTNLTLVQINKMRQEL